VIIIALGNEILTVRLHDDTSIEQESHLLGVP